MAFFDDLGKKLSQAGQSAVQKTKEMTDIAKLNGMISDEEKKIKDTYYKIGKLYVETHQSVCENEFADMLSAINESENKIKEYKDQIQEIKGIEKCSKCGAEVANGAAFCGVCGAPMTKEEPVVVDEAEDTVKKCFGCGAEIAEGVAFCSQCGTKVR